MKPMEFRKQSTFNSSNRAFDNDQCRREEIRSRWSLAWILQPLCNPVYHLVVREHFDLGHAGKSVDSVVHELTVPTGIDRVTPRATARSKATNSRPTLRLIFTNVISPLVVQSTASTCDWPTYS